MRRAMNFSREITPGEQRCLKVSNGPRGWVILRGGSFPDKKKCLITSTHSPIAAAPTNTVSSRLSQPVFQLKDGGHGQEFKGGIPRAQGPEIAVKTRDTRKSRVIKKPDLAISVGFIFLCPFDLSANIIISIVVPAISIPCAREAAAGRKFLNRLK
jgi:hypothetical protein